MCEQEGNSSPRYYPNRGRRRCHGTCSDHVSLRGVNVRPTHLRVLSEDSGVTRPVARVVKYRSQSKVGLSWEITEWVAPCPSRMLDGSQRTSFPVSTLGAGPVGGLGQESG